MPVEIDGGYQILEPLSMQMGAVIHNGWPHAVSKQQRVLSDNKQQTHECNNHVFFWASSNQRAQWLPKSIKTTCPSGQQATDTHVSQSRVLLGSKQLPCKVITYEYHNHVSLWITSNRHTRVTVTYSSGQQATSMHSDYVRVSQPRVPLDNKQQIHTCHSHVFWATSNHHAQWVHTNITTTCPSGQQATDPHVSQSRVLLGNKQPPCTVITYKYQKHVSFWTSKRQHVSQSRVLLGNKHPV